MTFRLGAKQPGFVPSSGLATENGELALGTDKVGNQSANMALNPR